MNKVGFEQNIVSFPQDFDIMQLRDSVSVLYKITENRGYQDIVLDFSNTEHVTPAVMIGLIAYCKRLQHNNIDFSLLVPNQAYLARLFSNSNWAHLLSPEEYRESDYRARTNRPATIFSNPDEQSALVNSVMDIVLESVSGYSRAQFKAIEWVINEITDNVLVHSNSGYGGIFQLNTKPTAKLIEFTVADSGDGIPRSLRTSALKISSDVEALAKAIERGVTRDARIGQGNGLYGSYQIAAKSGGKFDIHSGNATLYFTHNAGMHTRPDLVPYSGTLVHCAISYKDPLILEEILGLGSKFYPLDIIDFRYEHDESEALIVHVLKEVGSTGSRVSGKLFRTKLRNILQMEPERRLLINMEGVRLISSSFADEVFGKLFLELGALAFSSRINFYKVDGIVRQLIDKAISQRVAYGQYD